MNIIEQKIQRLEAELKDITRQEVLIRDSEARRVLNRKYDRIHNEILDLKAKSESPNSVEEIYIEIKKLPIKEQIDILESLIASLS